MIKDKKNAKNFIWNTIGSTLASFNSVFFLIAITRINGIEEAGIFTITFATASIFYIIAVYSGRNCQITDIKGEINNKEYITSRIITCLMMLIVVFGYVFIKGYDSYKNGVLIFLCVWKALEALSDVFYGVMQKSGELYKVGISLVIKAVSGFSMFVIIDLLTHHLVYATIALPLSYLITMLIYDWPQTKKLMEPNEKVQRSHVFRIYQKEFFLFANTFLIMYILNASKYAIEAYSTEEVQAVFGIILMPASILPLFAQFVVAPVINQLTNLYKENHITKMKQVKKKYIMFVLGFGVIAMLLGYTIGIPILNFVYNVNLNSYRFDLVLLLFAYVFYAWGYIETVILTIYRKLREQFLVYIITAIIIYILSYNMIAKIGVRGASIASVITMILYCSLLVTINRFQTKKEERKYEKE